MDGFRRPFSLAALYEGSSGVSLVEVNFTPVHLTRAYRAWMKLF